ncbi:MAG: permease-like cell division protein FtsX [Acidimicrobiales bacterium]
MMRVARWMLAVCAAVALVAGCTDGDEDAERDFCEFLGAGPDEPFDVLVFLDPDADQERIDRVRQAVDADPGVTSSEWIDQDAAHAEFVRLNENTPELIDAVSPEVMPSRIQVVLDGPVDEFSRRFQGSEGVYEVVEQPALAAAPFVDRFVRPLTMGEGLGFLVLAWRPELDQMVEPPESLRPAMQSLTAFWASPEPGSETVPDEVVQAAREVAAFHDTRCSADD